MADRGFGYELFTDVYPSGIAETEIPFTLFNQQIQIRTKRQDSRSRMGAYDYLILFQSYDGHLYEYTIPVRILNHNNEQTGDYEYTLYEYKPDLPQEEDPTKLGATGRMVR